MLRIFTRKVLHSGKNWLMIIIVDNMKFYLFYYSKNIEQSLVWNLHQ